MGRRVRSWAGEQLRRRRLALHPICAECKKRGIIRATKIIDHVVPLAFGGEDVDENTQGLCLLCNAIKTAAENATVGSASNWPAWLKPSAVPLEIVCGPPCAGKAAYVAAVAQESDVVIDVDGILKLLDPAYSRWRSGLDPALFNKAVRIRNAMLGSLARISGSAAYFIVSAPTPGERAWWQAKLAGCIVLLHPGLDECKRRALALGMPRAVAGVDRWALQSRLSWSPPKAKLAKVGVGDDGYPLEG